MYIGRFAPSPSGPLHFGSLLAATASYLEARSNQGRWLLRIEDLDKPRERTGAADLIIRTLDQYGFRWDGEIVYQSQRLEAYQQALEQLDDDSFLCKCTRKQLIATAQSGAFGVIYPGHCRHKQLAHTADRHYSVRLRVPDESICFDDAIQNHCCQNLEQELGDFIIRRTDKIFAYQLAVVVDDAWQNISHVVRGSDLLDNTPRQVYLQRCLKLPSVHYTHIPVANNPRGQKLSKQTHASALPLAIDNRLQQLCLALDFLGQRPPQHKAFSSVSELWEWAELSWNQAAIPRTLSLPAPNE